MKLMGKNVFGLVSLFIVLGASPSAWALGDHSGFSLSPAAFYFKQNVEINSVESELNWTFYDVRAGWTFDSGFYLGGIYAVETTGDGTDDQDRTSYGASIGYSKNGWTILGHYLISSEYKASTTTTYQKGSGFQVDFSYLFKTGMHFAIGPQLTYKKIDYKEVDVSDVVSDVELSYTQVLPMVVFAILF